MKSLEIIGVDSWGRDILRLSKDDYRRASYILLDANGNVEKGKRILVNKFGLDLKIAFRIAFDIIYEANFVQVV